jgi:hypothetical protein
LLYNEFMNNFFLGGGAVPEWLGIAGAVLPIVLLWSFFWKGLALWHSGRRGQPIWFVILLIVNTLGILEIIYLFGVLKLKFADLFSKR